MKDCFQIDKEFLNSCLEKGTAEMEVEIYEDSYMPYLRIFYLQGMNLSKISSKSDMESLIFEIITGAVFVLVIFILSRKTDWFSTVKKDDAVAWNEKIDAKIARKEEKLARKEAKIAAKNAPIGDHEESIGGKHYKH